MKKKRNYFVLNKEADFRRGWGKGVSIGKNGIRLLPGAVSGIYVTRIFDSRERQMIWHRLLLSGSPGAFSGVTVSVYAADSPFVLVKGEAVSLKTLVSGVDSKELPEGYADSFKKVSFSFCEDMLLHQVSGRYLWLKFELYGEPGTGISRVQVFFPRESWMGYLPSVYAGDGGAGSFLERYLCIFQTLYEDMTRRIEESPGLLNPWSAGEDPLQWLADWLAVENRELWTQEQFRYLIANSVRLYQYRGTVSYLKEMFRLYTGREVYVVERHSLERFFDGGAVQEELTRLYSSNPYEFTVLLNIGQEDKEAGMGALKKLADMTKPANMECRLVLLKPYIFLGQYSYLGINSVLGQYREFCLDGMCAIPFSTVAEGQRKGDQ